MDAGTIAINLSSSDEDEVVCYGASDEVYALRLKNKLHGQDCFYVGKTKDKARRVNEHKSGGLRCSTWVKQQGGVAEEVQLLIPREANLDPDTWEQKETIARILGHTNGFDCVRGWEWTNPEFGMEDYITFKKLALGAGNLCRKCGFPGHFATRCAGGRPKAPWLLRCLQGCKPPISSAKRACSSIIKTSLDASQIIASQVLHRGNERKRPHSLTSVQPMTHKQQRLCRQCKECNQDISDRPANHRLCLGCFRSAKYPKKRKSPEVKKTNAPKKNKSPEARKTKTSNSDHFERQCEECNQDISDRPANHCLCLGCFRSAKYGESESSESESESELSDSDQRGIGVFF